MFIDHRGDCATALFIFRVATFFVLFFVRGLTHSNIAHLRETPIWTYRCFQQSALAKTKSLAPRACSRRRSNAAVIPIGPPVLQIMAVLFREMVWVYLSLLGCVLCSLKARVALRKPIAGGTPNGGTTNRRRRVSQIVKWSSFADRRSSMALKYHSPAAQSSRSIETKPVNRRPSYCAPVTALQRPYLGSNVDTG